MDIHSRLRDARAKAGYASARQAAVRHQWPISTYIAHENGQNRYGPEQASAYAKAFKVSASWLLLGEGEPARPTPRLVGTFDPDGSEVGGADTDQDPHRDDFPPDAIIELAARGGMGGGQAIQTTYRRDGEEITVSDEIKNDYWRLPESFVRNTLRSMPRNLIVTEGQGDSMVPTINPKDPVCVDTSHTTPSPDGIYALRDDFGEVILKRLEVIPGSRPVKLRIMSDNPQHSTYERNAEDVAVIGKVLFKLQLF